MSVTYSFVCEETEDKIWCGQSERGTDKPMYFYTNDGDWPEIEKWLIKHIGKSIKLEADF